MAEMERILFINLSKAYKKPTTKRSKYAIKLLRALVARHTKSGIETVSISNTVGNAIVGRRNKPARSIKVKISLVDGKVMVMLPEEKKEAPKEAKKEEKKIEKTVEKGGKRVVKEEGEEKKEKTETELLEDKEKNEMNKLKR